MSRKNCYTSDYTKGRGERMEHAKIKGLIKGKTKMITMRINPGLLSRLDAALMKDQNYSSRIDFIEDCILKYLEAKGKI